MKSTSYVKSLTGTCQLSLTWQVEHENHTVPPPHHPLNRHLDMPLID